MNVVEWHPEELIDKRRQGRLTERESRKLDAHLDACAACRFELAVAEDLDDEDDASGEEDVTDLVLAVVNRRVDRDEDDAEAVVDEGDASRRRKVAVLAFAAAVLTSLSAAALLESRSDEPALRLAPPMLHPLAHSIANEVASADSADSADSEDEADEADAKDEAAQDDVDQASSAAPTASAPPASAQELFAEANAARRRGDRKQAIRLYQELQRRHPDSPEAKLSHATLGKLMLDSDDPEKALSSFDEYLQTDRGSLGEEALVGRAEALQRLGRKEQEKAAWRQLLAQHPSSIHAARARARLAELARGE